MVFGLPVEGGLFADAAAAQPWKKWFVVVVTLQAICLPFVCGLHIMTEKLGAITVVFDVLFTAYAIWKVCQFPSKVLSVLVLGIAFFISSIIEFIFAFVRVFDKDKHLPGRGHGWFLNTCAAAMWAWAVTRLAWALLSLACYKSLKKSSCATPDQSGAGGFTAGPGQAGYNSLGHDANNPTVEATTFKAFEGTGHRLGDD